MTYNPRIKIFDTVGAGSGVLIENWIGWKFTIGLQGGCLGGSFELAKYEAFRAAFDFTEGLVVRIYLDDADTPAYSGGIYTPKRTIGSRRHAYELSGLWSRLAGVRIEEASSAGSASDAHGDLDTCGKIADWLVQTFVVPAALGISYDAAEIACEQPVELLELREGMALQEIFLKLSYMGTVEGSLIAAGVHGNGKFYFKPVNETATIDLEIGRNVIDAEESPVAPETSVRLVLKGDVIPTSGYVAKRTFLSPWANPIFTRTRLIKLAGVWRRADLERFAGGYFVRHASPTIKVSGLKTLALSGFNDVLLPLNGLGKYIDRARGIEFTNYIGSVEVEGAGSCRVNYNLGLCNENDMASGAGDPYAPSALDALTGGVGSAENLFSDDINQLPEVDELTEGPVGGPTEDYPHLDGPEIGGGDGGTNLNVGQVFDLMAVGAVLAGETIYAQAEIANGGDTAALDNRVRFYYQSLDHSFNILTEANEAGIMHQTVNGLELWRSDAGFLPLAGGWVRIAVRVTPASDTVWYPADIGNGEIKGAKLVRVLDAGGIDDHQVFVVGWPVAGS